MVVSRFVIAIDTLVMQADGFKPACVRSVHWSSPQRRPVRVPTHPGVSEPQSRPEGPLSSVDSLVVASNKYMQIGLHMVTVCPNRMPQFERIEYGNAPTIAVYGTVRPPLLLTNAR